MSLVNPGAEKTFLTIEEHYKKYQESDGGNFILYLKQNISELEIKCIESLEQGTEAWHRARIGRITASNADSVRSLRDIKRSKSLINKVMGVAEIVKSKQTEHGKKNEPFARNMYAVDQSFKHKDLSVSECGLIVSPLEPYLGASPDGIVTCSCCPEKRVLEIKCPYEARDCYPVDIPKKYPKYHLCYDENGNLKLKETSAWYSQINFQLGILGLQKCHLAIHTQLDTTVIEINFDLERWEILRKKAKHVFQKGIIPQLEK